MGYHVCIVRTAGSRTIPIQLAEAKTALLGRNAWRFEESQSAFVALGLPDGEEFMRLQDGELWAKTPSEPMLGRMLTAAQHLNARVRGDELETYESVNKWYVHPDDEQELRERAKAKDAAAARRARRKRRLWIFSGALLVLLAIGAVRWWLRQ